MEAPAEMKEKITILTWKILKGQHVALNVQIWTHLSIPCCLLHGGQEL